MTYSKAALVQRVRDILGDSPWAMSFTANLSSTTTQTIAVPDGTRWDEGAILEFQDDGEQAFVNSVSSNNLTAMRNYNLSVSNTNGTGTTHNGSVTSIPVVRDPAVTIKEIQDAVNLTCVELWPKIYKVSSVTLTPSNSTTWYDTAADVMAPVMVTQVQSDNKGLVAYGYKGSGLAIALGFNLPTTLVTSGIGARFPRGYDNLTNTIQFTYAAKITATTSGSPATYSDFSDGIVADIMAYGAAARLIGNYDTGRVLRDDVNMGDASVSPGMRRTQGQFLYSQYLSLVNTYHEELRRTSPLMDVEGQGYGRVAPTGLASAYGNNPPPGFSGF